MAQAIWRGVVIAESQDTVIIEGNHYFPPDSIKQSHFVESSDSTICPWKGKASYYDIVVDGEVNPAAAWYYSSPKPAARQIADHIAFWRGVQVVT